MLNDFLCLIFHFSTSASSNNKISFCIFEYVRLDYVYQGKAVEPPQVFPDGEATTHYLLIKSKNLNQISAVASELIKNGLLKAFSCLCYWFLCCLIARYSPNIRCEFCIKGRGGYSKWPRDSSEVPTAFTLNFSSHWKSNDPHMASTRTCRCWANNSRTGDNARSQHLCRHIWMDFNLILIRALTSDSFHSQDN